jgi:hypothetical protein
MDIYVHMSFEDPGFESRQLTDLGLFTYITVLLSNFICIAIVCIWENKCFQKNFFLMHICPI